MAKMTTTQIQRAIRRALDDWRPLLGVDRWQISVRFQEPEEARHAGDIGDNAGTTCTPEYFTANLYFNVDSIRSSSDGKSAKHLSYLVLHELCHCLTWSLDQAAASVMVDEWHRRELESQTCRIARAIWVARYDEEPPE